MMKNILCHCVHKWRVLANPVAYVLWSYAIYRYDSYITVYATHCNFSSINSNITQSHYPTVTLMATTYNFMAYNGTEIIATTATSV